MQGLRSDTAGNSTTFSSSLGLSCTSKVSQILASLRANILSSRHDSPLGHTGRVLQVTSQTERAGRHILAIQRTEHQITNQDLSVTGADTNPTSPDLPLSAGKDITSKAQSVQDEAPIEDAAHQQAMQHGSGALDSGRELHRQLGQRFNASQADTAVANAQIAEGKTNADVPAVQAEITPGHGTTVYLLVAVTLPACTTALIKS